MRHFKEETERKIWQIEDEIQDIQAKLEQQDNDVEVTNLSDRLADFEEEFKLVIEELKNDFEERIERLEGLFGGEVGHD